MYTTADEVRVPGFNIFAFFLGQLVHRRLLASACAGVMFLVTCVVLFEVA